MDAEMSSFAQTIMDRTYAHDLKEGGKETWDNISYRVTKNVLRAVGIDMRQRFAQEMHRLISERKFIPAGRYLYAAGRQFHQIQNCLLLNAHDSREGWSELLAKASMALMTGAGIGVSYSDIRHEGSKIRKTGGTASGPISLMQIINECGRGIMQGGVRRCLPGDAPVSMADGTRKRIDKVKVGDFVFTQYGPRKVTSVFHQGKQKLIRVATKFGQVISSENHRWLGTTLMRRTQWVRAGAIKPGWKLYYCPSSETIGKYSHRYKLPGCATNRVPAEVLSVEEAGIEDTYDIEVDGEHEFVAYEHISHNSAILASLRWDHPDIHKFIHIKNWSPEVRELKARDYSFPATLDFTNISVQLNDEFFTAYHDDEHSQYALAQSVYWAVIEQMLKTGEPGLSVDVDKNAGEILRNAPLSADTHILTKTGYQQICEIVNQPTTIWTGKQWAKNVVFKQTGSDVQTLCIEITGGRKIKADPTHEFLVERWSKRDRQQERRLLTTERILAKDLKEGDTLSVQLPSNNSQSKNCLKVLDTYPGPVEDVFCCDVNCEEHTFVAEGVTVSNCGEVSSRDDSDICNLGSINLARIENLDELKHVVDYATAFLLAGTVYSDVPYSEVDRIRSKNRRLGLGLMGIHEWLLKRSKPYAPDEELGTWLSVYAKAGRYANKWADEWELSRPKKTRAIAPTGTTSIIAETTGGIEPIFCVAYKRRYLKGDQYYFQYVIDPCAKRLIGDDVEPSAIEDAYILARDVEKRVAFQAWVQGYVDHCISSTINLPAYGTELNNKEKIRSFGSMLLRYLPQLRGITVYPDGGRSGQPLTPVAYKEALEHEGAELVEEATDVCGLKGGSCGD